MRTLAALALLATAGCATTTAAPQRDFFTDLSSLCGKSFAGRITSPPAPADADFAGKAMVMQVRECSADTIRVPFHVADDHSRTWVVTRTAAGLRLKHDHRHKDGSEDKVTQYGGDSVTPVSAARQEFPADRFTKDLLIREGNTAGANNVWAVEFIPGRTFAYELRRPRLGAAPPRKPLVLSLSKGALRQAQDERLGACAAACIKLRIAPRILAFDHCEGLYLRLGTEVIR